MTTLFDQDKTSFDEVDQAEQAATFPGYLTRMAVDLAKVKTDLHDLLAVRPGDAVLDVGCGTGADVRALAERVGPTGRVTGVDNSQLLIDEAGTQTAGRELPVEYRVADAHDLPFPDATFDATRCERVMMHLADPAVALGELIRVTKPGGRLLVADPDHGMWALDHPQVEVTRSLLAWWFGFITNPWIARQMPARFGAAGLVDLTVSLRPILLPSLDSADAMTGITRTAAAGAAQGVITAAQQAEFDRELVARDKAGRFFMCGAIIATVGTRPPAGP
jgi:SAM-dependent methyltransferase